MGKNHCGLILALCRQRQQKIKTRWKQKRQRQGFAYRLQPWQL